MNELRKFQLLDNEPIDNSIIKRDYLKIYHQRGALLNDPDENVEFIFGENNIYHQIVISHLGFDITVRKADGNNFNFTNNPATNKIIGLVNIAFSHCFKEATLATTGGMEIEQVNFLGQVSTFMRVLNSEDGGLLSHFDKIDGTQNGSNNTSLKQMLINNHAEADRGKIKDHRPLAHVFRFYKTFNKITKNQGFHLTLKTNDLQDIIFTKIAGDINVTSDSLYLFVPVLIPNTETQVMFNESVKNNNTITYDSWYTERKLSTDGDELQVDIGSAQNVTSPKFLIATFQTIDRVGAHNKANNIAIFDHVIVNKYFC